MKKKRKIRGFSLTEVLLSVGILAVGMTFIAGVFPVAIYFTTVATERTIAAVAADEAFAKIKLCDIDPNWFSSALTTDCFDFNDVSSVPLNPNEFAYPSTDGDITRKQYYWSAICRYIGGRDVQVTVFISRKTGSSTTYQGWAGDWPVPVPVAVSAPGNEVLTIDESGKRAWINDGCTIVDNETGQLYRVLERDADVPNRIVLDRAWQGSSGSGSVWVIPPPDRGGRYPCIAIYQKVIGF